MLQIKGLVSGYREGFMLKDINLMINKGEFVGIIGPNGSGKTTLFRAVTKIINLIAGKIILNGRDIKEMGYKELAMELAVVSQDIDIMQGISVEEYVLLGRIPHRKRFQFFETTYDISIANKAMELTGIFEFKSRPINELSGGERQRVFISRALAQEPKLLLLDEPTTHLDIGHQIELLGLLKDLNRDAGLTIITILHDLNLTGCYCDRVVLMDKGRIYKEGGVEEVLTYQNIEEVYKTMVVVEKSPVTGKPYIFLIPKVSAKMSEVAPHSHSE